MGNIHSRQAPEHTLALLQAPAVELGPHGYFRKHTNRQGIDLAAYYWPVPGGRKPKAVIFLLHGHGAYIPFEYLYPNPANKPGAPKEYTNSWVERWNNEGYSVCGIDNQSSGRSKSVRGLRNDYNRLQDIIVDALDFVRSVKASADPKFGGGLPVFACGISLGGHIAVKSAHKEPAAFEGVVLLAPMLSLEKLKRSPINKVLRLFSWVLNFFVPTLEAVDVPRNTMFPEVQADLDNDPFMYHGMTRVRVAKEFVDSCERMVRRMHLLNFPFLAFHSRNDTMTDPEGTALLHACSQHKDRTLVTLEKMWHGLTREEGNVELHSQIVKWTNERAAHYWQAKARQ